jgi:hypothetical protein
MLRKGISNAAGGRLHVNLALVQERANWGHVSDGLID